MSASPQLKGEPLKTVTITNRRGDTIVLTLTDGSAVADLRVSAQGGAVVVYLNHPGLVALGSACGVLAHGGVVHETIDTLTGINGPDQSAGRVSVTQIAGGTIYVDDGDGVAAVGIDPDGAAQLTVACAAIAHQL